MGWLRACLLKLSYLCDEGVSQIISENSLGSIAIFVKTFSLVALRKKKREKYRMTCPFWYLVFIRKYDGSVSIDGWVNWGQYMAGNVIKHPEKHKDKSTVRVMRELCRAGCGSPCRTYPHCAQRGSRATREPQEIE